MVQKTERTPELITIDRSPKHFDTILNFLRDGDVPLPVNELVLAEVRQEAEFFRLNGLIQLCDVKSATVKKVTISDCEAKNVFKDHFKPAIINDDQKMVEILANIDKKVLNYTFQFSLTRCIFSAGVNRFLLHSTKWIDSFPVGIHVQDFCRALPEPIGCLFQ